MAYVKTHVVARRNGRGGRSAEDDLPELSGQRICG